MNRSMDQQTTTQHKQTFEKLSSIERRRRTFVFAGNRGQDSDARSHTVMTRSGGSWTIIFMYVAKNYQSKETRAVDRPLDSRWLSQRYELRCRGQPAADTTYFFCNLTFLQSHLCHGSYWTWIESNRISPWIFLTQRQRQRLLTIWHYCKHPNVTNTTKAWKGL